MKRNVFLYVPLMMGLLLMSSCEENMEAGAEGQSEVAIKSKTDQPATDENGQAENNDASGAFAEGTVISTAKVSVSEFELSVLSLLAETDILSELEIELDQPRVITLIADGKAQSEVIAEGMLQNAVYGKMEFDFHKNVSVESSDEMYGKSILIKGSHNGQPFVCWTDEENEAEVKFDDQGVKIEGSEEIYVTFNVYEMLSKIDFSAAVDGDADGTVEIGPGGVDGNTALYLAIKAGLSAMTSL